MWLWSVFPKATKVLFCPKIFSLLSKKEKKPENIHISQSQNLADNVFYVIQQNAAAAAGSVVTLTDVSASRSEHCVECECSRVVSWFALSSSSDSRCWNIWLSSFVFNRKRNWKPISDPPPRTWKMLLSRALSDWTQQDSSADSFRRNQADWSTAGDPTLLLLLWFWVRRRVSFERQLEAD